MSRTPDWLIERIALGELAEGELEKARAKLLSEPDGAARLAAVEASNAEILARLPAEGVASEVRRRLHLQRVQEEQRKPRRSWLPLALGAPLAAALALLFVLVNPGTDTQKPTETALLEGDRIKGLEPALRIYRQQGETSEPLKDGVGAREGDLLQLEYVPAGKHYGAIFSLDGSGVITLHLPERGRSAVRLEARAAVQLKDAYRLDDAPNFERFFFVTSDQPFELAPLLSQLAEAPGAAPHVRPPLHLITFRLEKLR